MSHEVIIIHHDQSVDTWVCEELAYNGSFLCMDNAYSQHGNPNERVNVMIPGSSFVAAQWKKIE